MREISLSILATAPMLGFLSSLANLSKKVLEPSILDEWITNEAAKGA